MKYLDVTALGRRVQRLALIVTTGVADAFKIVATGADGRIDSSLMPVGIGADTAILVASETIASGNKVNIWLDGSTPKARRSDASTAGKEADGFVLAGGNAGDSLTVYFEGRNTSLSGLTPGARYYTSAAQPGGITTTPPTATGNVVQYVGRAYSTTELAFEADDGIILA